MKSLNWVVLGAMALMAMLVAPEVLASGGRSLGDAAASLKDDTVTPVGQLFVYGFALIGVAVAGIGILKIINAKKNNEPISMGVGMVVGGAVLTALLAVIGLTTQSVVQEDPDHIETFGE